MADTRCQLLRGEADEAAFRAHFAEHNPGCAFEARAARPGERLAAGGRRRVLWLRDGEAAFDLAGAWGDEAGAPIAGAELGPGDLLFPGADGAAIARSGAELWSLEIGVPAPPASGAVRRLAALSDTSGGCNPGENAFRRLELTWDDAGVSQAGPDGDNAFGSHVVWIDGSKASPHYHPRPARGGGKPQHELYLILDPARFGLAPAEAPGIWVNPTPDDAASWSFLALEPGDVASIPAGVAHRGADILAVVVALPGFKPENEIVIGPPGAPAAGKE